MSKEEHQVELDYILRTLFLRKETNTLPVTLKENDIASVRKLCYLCHSSFDALNCATLSREIIRVDSFKISLIACFNDFLRAVAMISRNLLRSSN